MPVFIGKRFELIRYAARKLFSKSTEFFECALTPDEVEHLIIKPEDRKILRDAYDLLYPRGNNSYTTVPFHVALAGVEDAVEISLVSRTGFPFLIPNYAQNRHAAWVPEQSDVVERIRKWTAHRIEQGIEWGRVLDVITYLNQFCSSPQQMRFYFPGIVTVLVNSGDVPLEKLGNKLRTARTPSDFLSLTREQKEYIAQANTTLATAQLFLSNTPPSQPGCRPTVPGYGNFAAAFKLHDPLHWDEEEVPWATVL